MSESYAVIAYFVAYFTYADIYAVITYTMNLNWPWYVVATAALGSFEFKLRYFENQLNPVRSKLKRVSAAIQDNFCYTKKNSTFSTGLSTGRLSLL